MKLGVQTVEEIQTMIYATPHYKEPKLDMARRVISGSLFNESWVELDDEVTKLSDRVI